MKKVGVWGALKLRGHLPPHFLCTYYPHFYNLKPLPDCSRAWSVKSVPSSIHSCASFEYRM